MPRTAAFPSSARRSRSSGSRSARSSRTPRALREREFKGRMELVVSLTEGGQNAMMSFPEPADAGASAAFRLAFKYFRRVEGTFRINPKAKVENVQVRIYEAGANQPKATHTVTL